MKQKTEREKNLYLETYPNSYKRIRTEQELNDLLNLARPSSTSYVYVENPDGSVQSGRKAGGTTYKKSSLKKHVAGRDRVIYFGKHNKQYVKMKGAFVSVKSLQT